VISGFGAQNNDFRVPASARVPLLRFVSDLLYNMTQKAEIE